MKIYKYPFNMRKKISSKSYMTHSSLLALIFLCCCGVDVEGLLHTSSIGVVKRNQISSINGRFPNTKGCCLGTLPTSREFTFRRRGEWTASATKNDDSESSSSSSSSPTSSSTSSAPASSSASSSTLNQQLRNGQPSPPSRPGFFANIFRMWNAIIIYFRGYIQKSLAILFKTFLPYSKSPSGSKANRLLSKLRPLLSNKLFVAQASALSIITLAYIRYASKARTAIGEIPFSNFLRLVETAPERITQLQISPQSYSFLLDEKRRVITRVVMTQPALLEKLMQAGLDFSALKPPANIGGIIWAVAYMLFLWNMSTRMMQGPQDDGAGRRKDGAMLEARYGQLSFADIAGQDRAKQEVKEVCEMLKSPARYMEVGARLPSGVLLVGPPGTGKTLLARVTAAEAGVPFFSCSASDFVEVFVGRGPARVRKLFKQAAEKAPCIVFIDELDSLGRSRRLGSMNSEQESTLNQLLTSMDGLDTSNNGVIVMAATNRLDLLDSALLRAGRFDRIIQCPLPDKAGRLEILKVHTKKLNLAENVDLEKIAKMLPGTCGADIGAICNEAAIRTVRRRVASINAGAGVGVGVGDRSNIVKARDGSVINNASNYEIRMEEFDDAIKAFFSARGVPLSGLSEAIGLPNWNIFSSKGSENNNERSAYPSSS